jgi:Tfp pilus assembly protein PilF
LGASLIQRAQQYAAARKHTKAIEVLKEALVEGSALAYARSFLGVEYLKIGDLHAAIANLRVAVTLLPSLVANHSNLGYALCQTGDRKAGEQELREAIKADGTAPEPHFVLGLILLDRGATEAKSHLLVAQNTVGAARLALAVYYQRRGEMGAAQEELKEFIQLNHSLSVAGLTNWTSQVASLIRPTSAFGLPAEKDR